VALALAQFGRLDVTINNAGVGQRSLLSAAPVEDLGAVWETNVMGPLHLIQAALPHMKESGSGQIVNISSIVSQRPMLLSGMYNATKTALNFLSRSLRMELLGEDIVVSLVYVGLTNTEFPEARLGPNGGSFLNLRGVPPAKVARAVLKAVKSRRREVYVSWYDWVFVHANRLFPRTTDFFFARFGRYQKR
jgi:short-subunit dehydrogenase